MTRLILMLLLLLSTAPAYAEWVAIGASSGEEMTQYADPSTIRRKGDLVKVWELYCSATISIAG